MVRLCGKGRLGDRRNMGDDVLMLACVIVPFDFGPSEGGRLNGSILLPRARGRRYFYLGSREESVAGTLRIG